MLNLKEGWNLVKNSNVLIIGRPGVGKNVVSKLILPYDLQYRKFFRKEKILVIDSEKEYKKVASAYNGLYVNFNDLEKECNNIKSCNLVIVDVKINDLYLINPGERSSKIISNLDTLFKLARKYKFTKMHLPEEYTLIFLKRFSLFLNYVKKTKIVGLLQSCEDIPCFNTIDFFFQHMWLFDIDECSWNKYIHHSVITKEELEKIAKKPKGQFFLHNTKTKTNTYGLVTLTENDHKLVDLDYIVI